MKTYEWRSHCHSFVLYTVLLLASLTEARSLKVLMIDGGTPYVPESYSVMGKDQSITPYSDNSGHSSAVYQMIITGQEHTISCLNMTVDWCTFYMGKPTPTRYYYHCLQKAIKGNYDIINMSLESKDYSIVEFDFINELRSRSMVVIAAGNFSCTKGLYKCNTYPAAHSRGPADSVLAISAVDKQGTSMSYSNTDPNGLTIDFLGEGYYSYKNATKYIQGTSMAAALYTNKLVKEMCPSKKGDMLAKNNEYFKMMNRSEKDIEKRLMKDKVITPDMELLEDKIIQLEKREQELLFEIDRLKRGQKQGYADWPGLAIQQQTAAIQSWSTAINDEYDWGTNAQPGFRTRR